MAVIGEPSSSKATQPGKNIKRKRELVDLTLDSDSEDHPNGRAKAPKNGNSSTARQTDSTRPTPPYSAVQVVAGSAYSSYENVPGFPGTYRSQDHSDNEREGWLAANIELNEAFSSSQDDAEGSDDLRHYGDIATKIVGVQYYRGYANAGEQILMKREPGNPYDRNAIRIDNVAGTQIGHIPRTMAAKIAKYMDNRWLHLEGQLAGMKGQFDCPLTIHVYGPEPDSEEGRRVQEMMKADKLSTSALRDAERRRKQEENDRLAAARKLAAANAKGKGKYANQASSGGFKQPDMADILEASQRINPREIGQVADSHGASEEQLKSMSEAAIPEGIKTTMLPYQLQALQWLLEQENPELPQSVGESAQLWCKSSNGGYTNLATTTTQADPKLARGGILADDMGLGKTLEMISLILADAADSGRGTTLIVAPLSVMSNWSGQIAAHVKDSHMLKVYTYHSNNRVKMSADDLSQFDVVITTYHTLASDYMPAKSSSLPDRKLRTTGLYSLNWRRIILDEGHQVRNPKAKITAAVNALLSRARWVLTGTPIVNSLKDLYSLLRFVGVTGGLEQLEIFNRVLVRPLRDGDESATLLLQAIMASFTLRRRKEMAFIDLKLPKLDEFMHRVNFTDKEKERYEALNAEAQGLLKKVEQASTGQSVHKTYQHLLEILLRMRQCCNHWQLCGERVTNLLAQLEGQKVVELTPENKKALQDVLQVQIESQDDCAVCLEPLHNPVITTCGHAFGYDCIARVIETQHKCPMCRAELEDDHVLVEPANECGDESAAADLDLTQSSSKLEALVKILDAIKSSGNKTVIFSQWTSFLDIVQSR